MGPMDTFVCRMSREELAAQHEWQSEDHNIFIRMVLRTHEGVVTQRRRGVDAERQRRHRERKKTSTAI